MTRLERLGQRDSFGRFFVFRALGWSTGSALAGLLYQVGVHFRLGGASFALSGPGAVILTGLVGLRGLQFAISLALTMPTAEKPAAHDQQGGASTAGGIVKAMLCDRHVLIFLVRIDEGHTVIPPHPLS